MSLTTEFILKKWKEERDYVVALTMENASLQEDIAELTMAIDKLSDSSQNVVPTKLYSATDVGKLCGYNNPESFNEELVKRGIQRREKTILPYPSQATHLVIEEAYRPYVVCFSKKYYKWNEAGKDKLVEMFNKDK